MKELWVIGAGGLSKKVIDTVRSANSYSIVGILDDATALWNTDLLGVPVRGEVSPQSLAQFGVDWAVLGIGNTRVRAEIAKRLDGMCAWATVIHPTAHIASRVQLGQGTVVFAGGIVEIDSIIGQHCLINTACSIAHDCLVGDYVHLAPGVRLAGDVNVGSGAFLGISSCVIPGRTIGDWATVGAGSVVVRDIPPGVTAKGVPARFVPPEDS